jgi:hypothetical protein
MAVGKDSPMRLALMLVLATWWSGPSHAEDNPASAKAADLIARSAFCIAYVIRDADQRDLRPPLKGDPFQTKEDVVHGGSILGKGEDLLDVAALASRATAQARISKEQISRLTTALFKTNSFHPMASCYEPHHAVVFYSDHGEPTCCIEICFSCNEVKTAPKLREKTCEAGQYWIEGADLVGMAKIFDELKLPLIPYKTWEDLKTQKEAQVKEHKAYERKRRAEEEQEAATQKK